jgi:hypothetical protein
MSGLFLLYGCVHHRECALSWCERRQESDQCTLLADDDAAGPHSQAGRWPLTPPCLGVGSCSAPTMAVAHVHAARRLLTVMACCSFSMRSTGGQDLLRLVVLLDDQITKRQAEQIATSLDPDLECLLPL